MLLLLLYLLLLLELLLPLGVYLLLDGDVVLRGGTLLLCLAEDQGGVYSSRAVHVLTSAYIAEHTASGPLAPAVVLSAHVVPRGAAQVLGASMMVGVRILTAPERSHDHVLHVVVDGEVDGRLLHFDFLLSTGSAASD